ncbi:hypothetical protein [Kitasatospora sp. MBT66]|uniref:hypothetical protein n=1 Tax=Kitasatospora sp. MBT66 TaxID=1444769 RepID=UPI0006EB9D50|nr:hypothetical protein [Kitasatospora sp. MBT66]
MTDCVNCHAAPAAIEDIGAEPPRRWCLGCATALVRAGDPVLDYRPLGADGDVYARVLAAGSTETLPFC